MSNREAVEQRIIHLEELLAHHQHTVQQLSDELAQLRADHDRLKAKCEQQARRLEELAENLPDDSAPADEKPPHY